MYDLSTLASNTWCVGCGDFGIFQAIKDAIKRLEGLGIGRDRLIMTAGIGCHGKIFDYLALSGFYSLHGRAVSTAQGIKIANPDLSVICFEGDGSAFGEGIEHMIFAAKRNIDVTVFLHHNSVYGLTTGQASPLSDKGFRGRSTPRGSQDPPLDPVTLMLDSGASFIARGYTAKLPQLTDVMVKAILHKGFSFVDILQPCVTFNNTYAKYAPIVEDLDRPASTREEAWLIAQRKDKVPLGVIYGSKEAPWERQVPKGGQMSKDERHKRIRSLLGA